MGKWVICIIMLVASINCQAQKEDLAVMDSIAQADSKILFGDSMKAASDTTSIIVKKKEKKPHGNPIHSVPSGWHWYCRVPDRYTTASSGNCPSSTAGLSVVSMR